MAKQRVLDLTPAERAELERAARKHALPYMREKASALLKVADGISAHRVAQGAEGLVRRHPDTIYSWLNIYTQEGLEGLLVKKGRGRKAAFSPSLPKLYGGGGRHTGTRA